MEFLGEVRVFGGLFSKESPLCPALATKDENGYLRRSDLGKRRRETPPAGSRT